MAACVTAGEATWRPAASPGFLLTGPGLTHDEPGTWERKYRGGTAVRRLVKLPDRRRNDDGYVSGHRWRGVRHRPNRVLYLRPNGPRSGRWRARWRVFPSRWHPGSPSVDDSPRNGEHRDRIALLLAGRATGTARARGRVA